MSEKWAKRGGAFYREKLKRERAAQEAFRKELDRKPRSTRIARALVRSSKTVYDTSRSLYREVKKESKARRSRKT